MKIRSFAAAAILTALPVLAADADYVKSVEKWRADREASLRRDNGWLTLAGRYVMKPGLNTFGTGKGNDIVFPEGLGPERMGTIEVAPGKVLVKLAPGLAMTKDGMTFTEREMGTRVDNRDWVKMGRANFFVFERDGRYILRLADNESQVRKNFLGRVWFDVKESYRVPARYVPYNPPRSVAIVNVIDEVSDVPVPGYVEFRIGTATYRLDVIGDEEEGLSFVFRDETAGKGTYPAGRFLDVEPKPKPNETFLLDLNLAYNPPCAFSEFTTCPLPPKQNVLKVKIEAGEKYPPKRAG